MDLDGKKLKELKEKCKKPSSKIWVRIRKQLLIASNQGILCVTIFNDVS